MVYCVDGESLLVRSVKCRWRISYTHPQGVTRDGRLGPLLSRDRTESGAKIYIDMNRYLYIIYIDMEFTPDSGIAILKPKYQIK